MNCVLLGEICGSRPRLRSLAEIPHPHGVAGSSVEEGAGRVEGNLVDLALPRWDGQAPDR